MAKLKYKDNLDRGALFPSGAVGMNTVKDNGLNVVAVPEEYWNSEPPAGYSRVTNGQQAQNPGYVEQNRGSWGIADNAFMTDEDWNTVQGYKQQYETAKAAGDQAGMDATHAAAENIRLNNYGYSGGGDGNAYNQAMAFTGRTPVFEEEEDGRGADWGSNGYLSKYQSRIDALADAILNREAFSYDKDKDPLYQQYKDSYTRGGKRGMQDTLAQVSARTGGLASSYAQGAAQQTYNNYMAELANKIPELYKLAYSMYMDELGQDRADLSMLQELDDTAYGRFTDQRDFDYGVYRDGVSDNQWQQQFDYQKEQDALAQQNWQTQWDYQMEQDALARQDALSKLQGGSTGGGGDTSAPAEQPDILGALSGMSEEEAQLYLIMEGYNNNERETIMEIFRNANAEPEAPAEIDNTEGLALLRELERDGATTEQLRAALTDLYENGLITEEAYLRRQDRYR